MTSNPGTHRTTSMPLWPQPELFTQLSAECLRYPRQLFDRTHLEKLAAQGTSAHQEEPLRLQGSLNAAPEDRNLCVMATALHSIGQMLTIRHPLVR